MWETLTLRNLQDLNLKSQASWISKSLSAQSWRNQVACSPFTNEEFEVFLNQKKLQGFYMKMGFLGLLLKH